MVCRQRSPRNRRYLDGKIESAVNVINENKFWKLFQNQKSRTTFRDCTGWVKQWWMSRSKILVIDIFHVFMTFSMFACPKQDLISAWQYCGYHWNMYVDTSWWMKKLSVWVWRFLEHSTMILIWRNHSEFHFQRVRYLFVFTSSLHIINLFSSHRRWLAVWRHRAIKCRCQSRTHDYDWASFWWILPLHWH